jgi:hypothetical protein
VLPLVSSNNFLTSNFGHLLNFSQAVDADLLTGNLNWNICHWVEMHQDSTFQVHSDSCFNGRGFPAKELIEHFNSSNFYVESTEPMSKYILRLIEKMESAVRKAEIFGKSEHTLYIKATNEDKTKFGIISLPILINSRPKRYEKR